jgi:hypothetical protein
MRKDRSVLGDLNRMKKWKGLLCIQEKLSLCRKVQTPEARRAFMLERRARPVENAHAGGAFPPKRGGRATRPGGEQADRVADNAN